MFVRLAYFNQTSNMATFVMLAFALERQSIANAVSRNDYLYYVTILFHVQSATITNVRNCENKQRKCDILYLFFRFIVNRL